MCVDVCVCGEAEGRVHIQGEHIHHKTEAATTSNTEERQTDRKDTATVNLLNGRDDASGGRHCNLTLSFLKQKKQKKQTNK